MRLSLRLILSGMFVCSLGFCSDEMPLTLVQFEYAWEIHVTIPYLILFVLGVFTVCWHLLH